MDEESPGLIFDVKSNLYWPANESVDRCFKYMIDRVCDVDYLVKHARTKGVCVQAGGFVGMFPLRLAKFFERVYTFEPIPHIYESLMANTSQVKSIVSECYALSSAAGNLPMELHRSGCSRHNASAPTFFLARTIDSLELPRCDAIYLDVEKHEVAALEGAADTIKKFAPAIMVETHPDQREAQDRLFSKLGYKEIAHVHSDRVFVRK